MRMVRRVEFKGPRVMLQLERLNCHGRMS